MVADDVIPIPRDQPVDHKRGSVAGSEVNISSDDVSNLCDRPVRDSETEWDNEVPQEPGDPGYWAYIYHLVSQALRTGEDTLVNDEYPEVVTFIVENVRMSARAWYEHDRWLEEQQTGCTTPGCQCVKLLILCFGSWRRGWKRMTQSWKISLTGISGHAG